MNRQYLSVTNGQLSVHEANHMASNPAGYHFPDEPCESADGGSLPALIFTRPTNKGASSVFTSFLRAATRPKNVSHVAHNCPFYAVVRVSGRVKKIFGRLSTHLSSLVNHGEMGWVGGSYIL